MFAQVGLTTLRFIAKVLLGLWILFALEDFVTVVVWWVRG